MWRWYKATSLLLYLTKQMAEDFQCPVLKKVEVWPKVAVEMLAKGLDFGAEACDSGLFWYWHFHCFGSRATWRHLLCLVSILRYKTIVDNKMIPGWSRSRLSLAGDLVHVIWLDFFFFFFLNCHNRWVESNTRWCHKIPSVMLPTMLDTKWLQCCHLLLLGNLVVLLTALLKVTWSLVN